MSHLFALRMSYVQVTVCGMCVFYCLVCAGFMVRYVQCLVCVLCGLYSVSCAVFSLCYVQFAVMSLISP